MRLGELLNCRWGWIDFTQDIIIVKNTNEFKTKNKRERIIPLHPKVKAIFQRLLPKCRYQLKNFVFCRYQGIRLNENFVSKEFKKTVRLAKLNEIFPLM